MICFSKQFLVSRDGMMMGMLVVRAHLACTRHKRAAYSAIFVIEDLQLMELDHPRRVIVLSQLISPTCR